MIVSNSHYAVQVWESTNGALLPILLGFGLGLFCARVCPVSPNMRHIISGAYDRTIRVWDVTTSSQVSELRGHGGQVNSICFSPDGRQIISGSDDKTVRIWDIKSDEIPAAQRGHNSSVACIAFSSDGDRVASGSFSGAIRILDAKTGSELAELEGHWQWPVIREIDCFLSRRVSNRITLV
jgi:WD40 repeat protein